MRNLNFKILGQNHIETMQLPEDTTTETLKALISDFCSIPPNEMRLLYKGKAFKTSDSLSSLNIPDGATINVVPIRKETKNEGGQDPENSIPTPISNQTVPPVNGTIIPEEIKILR